MDVIKNKTHLKLQILTKFQTTKSIFYSLLIEHLQASIWRELLMFTVLIGLYRSNIGSAAEGAQIQSCPFFCNYELTLSPYIKISWPGDKGMPLKNKSAETVNRRMNQLI